MLHIFHFGTHGYAVRARGDSQTPIIADSGRLKRTTLKVSTVVAPRHIITLLVCAESCLARLHLLE
jgi:hypothetical protein